MQVGPVYIQYMITTKKLTGKTEREDVTIYSYITLGFTFYGYSEINACL